MKSPNIKTYAILFVCVCLYESNLDLDFSKFNQGISNGIGTIN